MPEGHSNYGHMYTPRLDLGDNARAGTVVVIHTDTKEIVTGLLATMWSSSAHDHG